MQVIRGDIKELETIEGITNSVVVVGNFDGLHVGHQKLLQIAQDLAIKNNLALVLVTFDIPFKKFLNKTDDRLMIEEEKISLIDSYFAVDYYIELKTNKNLHQSDKNDFMNWLKWTVKCEKIVEGSDFTFGTDREGTVKDLQQFFGNENVIVVKRKLGAPSSTKIRRLISEGKVEKVNKLLYTPFKIYFLKKKSTLKMIDFPRFKVKDGYYEVEINDQVKATILVIDQSASIISVEDDGFNDEIKYAALIKYLGETIS